MTIRGSWREEIGSRPTERHMNAAEEEEVAVGDVTVNGDDSASKNNAASVVL